MLENADENSIREFMTIEKREEEEEVIPVVEETPPFKVPEKFFINDFSSLSSSDFLKKVSQYLEKINLSQGKGKILFSLSCLLANYGCSVEMEGVLEINRKDGYGMLRSESENFKFCPYDAFLSSSLLKEHEIRTGQRVRVGVVPPKGRAKYLEVSKVFSIEGEEIASYNPSPNFAELVSIFPEERFIFDNAEKISPRMIDLVAPLGKGQRGLIVASPRGGKTVILKEVAVAIKKKNPEVDLMVLLLDERPEEVTIFEEEISEAFIFSSTFDESSKRHAHLADMVIERCKRLVEQGRDVVLLLDSLTRLARGYNASQKFGAIGTGGLNPVALERSRKFFSTARNIENGGSLTILATVLVGTESKMDDIIFEELKGTGNMEICLDFELAQRRIFPAIHIPQSGTRNDDKLYHPDEFEKILAIRKQLARLQTQGAAEALIKAIQASSGNSELLMKGGL